MNDMSKIDRFLNTDFAQISWDGLYISICWPVYKIVGNPYPPLHDTLVKQNLNNKLCYVKYIIPHGKVHGANMGPIWGRQDLGGPHVGPWTLLSGIPTAQLCKVVIVYLRHISFFLIINFELSLFLSITFAALKLRLLYKFRFVQTDGLG